MRIGHIELGDRPLLLAPMEDVSDPPFRLICKRLGADLLYTEFISSGGLVHDAADSLKKLDFREAERPLAIQIFGGDLDQVCGAVAIVDAVGPDIIDLNFGCPVKKVVCNDAGAAILKDLPRMRRLTEATVQRTRRPVTVKTRLGWSDDTIQILEVARMLEDCGIQALAVHARTRTQMYKGTARWDWLKRLKDEAGLRIPLIGNGDATSPEKVRDMFEQTGVDAVMIGRGAIGNPWIFRETRHLLEHGQLPPSPSWAERARVAAEHLRLKCEWMGERRGVLEMRKNYGGYFKGMPNGAVVRGRLMEITELPGVLEILGSVETSSIAEEAIPEPIRS